MKKRISTWSMSVCFEENIHNSQSQIHWHRRWIVFHLSTWVPRPPERHRTIKQRDKRREKKKVKIEPELTAFGRWCSYFSSGSSRYCPHWRHFWSWFCGDRTQMVLREPALGSPISAALPVLPPDHVYLGRQYCFGLSYFFLITVGKQNKTQDTFWNDWKKKLSESTVKVIPKPPATDDDQAA